MVRLTINILVGIFELVGSVLFQTVSNCTVLYYTTGEELAHETGPLAYC